MDKLWLQHYQEGVPHEINLEKYESIVHLFEESCQKFEKNPAYENMGCTITYGELDQLSLQFSAYLQHAGLKKGARVGIMMPNLLQYPIVLFAILRGGYAVVNVNPLYTSDELSHQINDSGAETLIVLENFAHTVEKARSKCPALKQIVITEVGDVFPFLKRHLVNSVVKYVKRMVPSYQLPGAIKFHQALEIGKKNHFQTIQVHQEDIAFLQYTGGTTGISKAAVLTHRNMVANVLQASAWIAPVTVEHEEVIVTALPLYHIFSLTANCLTFFKLGAKNLLITNPKDIAGFIKTIKEVEFTVMTGVNTLYHALLSHPDFKKVNFSKLKIALSGGMALHKNVSDQWHEISNTPILEAYGLTETSPAVTMNPMYLTEYNGSIGLPIPSTELSIRDETGCELPVGEHGELCVKGPQVMAGYWNRPDEDELVFWPDGFLRTGDIAKIDQQGYLYIVDRKKDMILVSGFNVYPAEVEQIINLQPGVLEVGVIGVLEDKTGETVKACVVKQDPSLTAEQIMTHCREHLTAYKIPKIIEFYDELPKTNVGKILRRALR